jgi:Fur family ferric uptake transcriptional regulator
MNFKELIKKKNLKFTPARENILELFAKNNTPLSYEDIKVELSMDKATFYRNMLRFEEEGIFNGFESSNKKRYYELAQKEHAHFICSRCYGVECLNEQPHFKREGYRVQNIIIHGICPQCSN